MFVTFSTLCFMVTLHQNNCYSVHSKLPEVYGENVYSHLKFKHINAICNNRIDICSSNNTKICAIRVKDKKEEYRNFKNSCFLFLSNMCDNPGEGKYLLLYFKFDFNNVTGVISIALQDFEKIILHLCWILKNQEYHIIEDDTCEVYLETRRIRRRNSKLNTTSSPSNATKNATFPTHTSPTLNLRSGTTVSILYDIDTAFDYHVCPLSCPETYSPVCVSANRGAGKYFKLLTFVNHCQGDVYYCKHFDEFAPPPDEEEENVNSSPLSWSYCGAYRYMQFARFSEVLSSMGHYGWLAGDERYSAILAPEQRRPGYG
ncbi:uncharacterized protein LOC114350541 [Ostrinia furnacalis]|uniref:uncharacterized protein LOC114350541 n=1 Tax=Ostrinia furnacalis TaxID=93504 RepID=UPI0010395138|nr:uncharacterized protein LOC114350541 [Ostrinia furnacalis]